MGWTFRCDPQSKADLVKDRVRDQFNSDGSKRWQCLAHSLRGSVLWTVWEVADISGNRQRFIGCDLLGTHGGAGYGYKDMSESMHPYQYSCPLKFLDMVPVACEEWREGVRKFHARNAAKRARKFSVGDVVELVPNCKPPRVTITSVKPMRGEYEGRLYKISPRHVA